MEKHELFYYGYQTVGRGVTSSAMLEQRFIRQAVVYDELIGKLLPTDLDARCVDLGCGYGNFLYYLTAQGRKNAVGFDLTESQVEWAKSLGLNANIGDARTALQDAKDLALVAAFDLIEHLDKNDVVDLLLAAHRALMPGGILLVQCPCADGFRGAHDLCNDFTHKWAPTSNTLRQILGAAGFKKVQLIDMTLPPFPNSASMKVKLRIRKLARSMLKPLLTALGTGVPEIWSNSVIAVAWKY
jgi:SAM-dependent methyltransferase